MRKESHSAVNDIGMGISLLTPFPKSWSHCMCACFETELYQCFLSLTFSPGRKWARTAFKSSLSLRIGSLVEGPKEERRREAIL